MRKYFGCFGKEPFIAPIAQVIHLWVNVHIIYSEPNGESDIVIRFADIHANLILSSPLNYQLGRDWILIVQSATMVGLIGV